MLLGDHLVEHAADRVDDRGVGEGALEDHDSRSFEERLVQLGLHGPSGGRVGAFGSEAVAVVADDVLLDRFCERIVAEFGCLFDDRDEVVESAVGLVKVPTGGVGIHGGHTHKSRCREASHG